MVGTSTGFDSVLDLCRHQHRRIVLGTLLEEGRPLTLDDLTEAVLRHNHQMPITEAPEDVITEIGLTLHHLHLPKLAAEGLVDYDPEGHLVEPTDELARAEPTLSAIIESDTSLQAPIEL